MRLVEPKIKIMNGLTYEDADSLLRKFSKTYENMADYVKSHGGYRIATEDTEFFGCWFSGRRLITLRPDVKGARMVSVLAFEMTNAFQNYEHLKVDRDARNGLLNMEQFVERHETIEYHGQLMHYQVIKELSSVFGELPKEMFILNIPPNKKDLTSWIFPDLETVLKAQNDAGHSDFYRRWYPYQRGFYKKS
jgi:hypothetical protein